MTRAKPGPSEHQIQQAFFDYCEQRRNSAQPGAVCWALVFAIPNGGHRSKAVAGKLKAEGVRRGVPDICVPVSRRGYHSMWIELKRPGERPSDAQKAWIGALRAQGHYVVVLDSTERAIEECRWYFGEIGGDFEEFSRRTGEAVQHRIWR